MHTETFGGDAPTTEDTRLATAPSAVEGQLEASDLDIPRINVAQKMSSDVPGRPGQISIGKEFVLYEPDVKIPINILSAKKAWKEKIPYGSDARPRFAQTVEEAKALEAESEYEIMHFAEFVILVAHTPDCLLTEDDVFSAFPYEIDGHHFALAKLTAQSFGYDTTFKRVATAQATNPGLDLSNIIWNFQSVEKSSPKYKWHIPQFALTRGTTTPAVAEFLSNLKGGSH